MKGRASQRLKYRKYEMDECFCCYLRRDSSDNALLPKLTFWEAAASLAKDLSGDSKDMICWVCSSTILNSDVKDIQLLEDAVLAMAMSSL